MLDVVRLLSVNSTIREKPSNLVFRHKRLLEWKEKALKLDTLGEMLVLDRVCYFSSSFRLYEPVC